MLFTMKSEMIRTNMWSEIFLNTLTFFADKKIMILATFLVCTECPATEKRNMMDEFMLQEEL